MSPSPILRVYLEAPMLRTAREGSFNFLNVLRDAVAEAGWSLEWHLTGDDARARAPELDGYALYHCEAPTHDRALTFRRAYHYPFWRIEPLAQRWRFEVAQSRFDPETIDPQIARRFCDRLRTRVLPGPPPQRTPMVLVPLQEHIRQCRSFQTMSPLDMLNTLAASGRAITVTLHPSRNYDPEDMEALQGLVSRHRNLKFGAKTAPLLRDCDFVVTQNSAVAFDGYLLGKSAVLCAQIDFHHIGLNVAELGMARALELAPRHQPEFDRYIYWFLQEKAINATLADAKERIRAEMRRGGWPI